MLLTLLRLTTHQEELARQAESLYDYMTVHEWVIFGWQMLGVFVAAIGLWAFSEWWQGRR